MSEVKQLLPVVERCSLTVTVPMSKGIAVIRGWTIHEEIKRFTQMKESAKNRTQYIECDMARALLEYALLYEAKLVQMQIGKDTVSITLSFKVLDVMLEFYNTMDSVIYREVFKETPHI